jgi:ClpP class serine protease
VQDFLTIIYILFLIQIFVPLLQKRMLQGLRLNAIRNLEAKRRSRVITMIHRQETMSLLGFPIARYIDIEDSEKVLRAIRLTPPEMPIDLIVHTPGGLVLAAEQIALALKRHRGDVTVFIPHYAMSGGTLIALAADSIVMDPNAVLGPVDPQLGSPQGGYFPAASVLAALETPNPNRDDQTLIMGDVARKALDQVERSVRGLLQEHYSDAEATALARALSEGRWTHDYPIDYEEAKELGLRVSEEMPQEIYRLMDLYPQARQQRPGVEYIPTPYRPAPAPGARERRD